MWKTARFTVVMLTTFLIPSSMTLSAEEMESFTEPYKQIAISTGEVGVLAKLMVAEGDTVTSKQILASLDDTVLTASLAVAQAAKDALGTRNAAEIELKSKTKQLESFRQLREQGNATQRELDRSESDQLQSKARLLSVQEELEVRRLEYLRVKAQILQRRMESPIDGVVTKIDKEVGEFVSPTNPIVMHVAQLDTLKSVFWVPIQDIDQIKKGQTVKITVGYRKQVCDGVIEFVSPVADHKSETIRVTIRIPNAKGDVPSGAVCRWNLGVADPVERLSRPKQGRSRSY